MGKTLPWALGEYLDFRELKERLGEVVNLD
jgi:hypothetical protein